MTQEFERRRQRRYDESVELPPREALSVDQVEAIIGRATELQAEADFSLPTLDEDALHRVARELGIQPGHLRRAIAEARTSLAKPEPSILERILAPMSVIESRVVHGDRDAVESRLGEWMTRQEGLRLRRKDRDGGVWEKDPHLVTKLRMGLRLGRGSRVLRNSRKVAHRIQSIRDDEQALALEAETHTIKIVGAAGLAALGALASAGAAYGVATGSPEVAIPAALGGLALTSGGLIVGVRMWVNRIREGLRRVLDGVSSQETSTPPDSLDRHMRDMWRNWRQFQNRRGI